MVGQNILVLGSGAREHALAWKLQQSELVERVFVAPGNANTYSVTDDMELKTVDSVRQFCLNNHISMIVIGPEKEICAGWADELSGTCAVFAPSANCARLEASKSFAKEFMVVNNLPTAEFKSFNNIHDAVAYVQSVNWQQFVVKEDGLCAGKGVTICKSKAEAISVIEETFTMTDNELTPQFVVEEFLDGFEVSAMCFSDGTTISRLPLSQDHKRALEGDLGENTGGMGAIAPIVLASDVDDEITKILQNTVNAMKLKGTPYKGILYAGLMITSDGPKLLEYNCRFGDPETEVLMRLLENDLCAIMHACVDGTLADLAPTISWRKGFAVGIVVASDGYPRKFQTGISIKDIPNDNDSVVTFFAGAKRSANGELCNSGGRVLCVTSVDMSPFAAKSVCVRAVEAINFPIKHYRRDIGNFLLSPREVIDYVKSGVNIDEGNAFVEEIKKFCKLTLTSGTEQIGGFGAIVDLGAAGFDATTQLVVGVDGVGTKLELAERAKNYGSIGYDLVGMCANDVLCHAARPLAFFDYYVTGKLQRSNAVAIVKSVADACIEAKCALAGGETAEMPGVYLPKQWDIAGCCIGARQLQWPRLPLLNRIAPGDRLIALASNGLHSNGFSLVRRILDDCGLSLQDTCPWDNSVTLADELLKPTKIYVKSLFDLSISGNILAMAHITGGGIVENLPRVIPKHFTAKINCNSWKAPELFTWLRAAASISIHEMLKTFNCGIGMIIIVPSRRIEDVKTSLSKSSTKFYDIGTIEKPQVEFENSERLFNYFFDSEFTHKRRINVAILISGTGSNMVELIKQSRKHKSFCFVSVVISNRADATGLETARRLGIESITVLSKNRSREEFEADVCKELNARGVELICLAGFMRLLTGQFIQSWPDRILNIHPSLLPSFKGVHAVRSALEAGVKVTGCTAHYVMEDMDAGKILGQAIVRVDDNDDESSLHQKIQIEEHKLFPTVMQQQAKLILDQERT